MKYKIVKTADETLAPVGTILTAAEVAQLMESNAALIEERSQMAESLSKDGFTFIIQRGKDA